MPYSIVITEPARQGAEEYAAYIRDERESPAAAAKWLMGLYEAIKRLEDFPGSYSVIAEAAELGFPYRSFVYHSHRVVFAVHDPQNRVIVHRIYHGARKPLCSDDVN